MMRVLDSLKGVINRNSIHTGPERDRLIPIKLQLGPGVEIIGIRNSIIIIGDRNSIIIGDRNSLNFS